MTAFKIFDILVCKIIFSLFLFVTFSIFILQINLINKIKNEIPILYNKIVPNMFRYFYFVITPFINIGPDILDVVNSDGRKEEDLPENIKHNISLIRLVGKIDTILFVISVIVIIVFFIWVK